MRCFHPIDAYQDEDGTVGFRETRHTRIKLTLRCGRCIGCRVTRSKEWQIRCVHEASLHKMSSFITLTYEGTIGPSLEYLDFQRFMRRLRKKVGKVRFFMSGEYGERGDRPHFHALLFGIHFEDRQLWRRTRAGYNLYRSKALEDLWTAGHSTIGDVTPGTAAYCARYVVKKIGGWQADVHYLRVDERTGEEMVVRPEFGRMSLKPGIGFGFLTKYQKEIYRGDHVVMEGRPVAVPRYYDKCFEQVDEDAFVGVQFDRYKRKMLYDDKDWNRLATIEEVAEARIKTGKGEL